MRDAGKREGPRDRNPEGGGQGMGLRLMRSPRRAPRRPRRLRRPRPRDGGCPSSSSSSSSGSSSRLLLLLLLQLLPLLLPYAHQGRRPARASEALQIGGTTAPASRGARRSPRAAPGPGAAAQGTRAEREAPGGCALMALRCRSECPVRHLLVLSPFFLLWSFC